MTQRIIALRDVEEERALFGSLDRNLHLLRRLFNVDAVSRGGQLRLTGGPAELEAAAEAVERALDLLRGPGAPDADQIERIFRGSDQSQGDESADGESDAAPSAGRLRTVVQPRTANQRRYLDAIAKNTVTFGIGPAGTGKSFLAVAAAVASLKSGQHRKIVLCRPAVEAGESLGFLPGDLSAKINPYLRPLYDALEQVLPRGDMQKLLDRDVIEILPLAYMRGRTLSRSVIILDEAQNCTTIQMKMALTRIGENSKMIVTGDITQIDLPPSKASGLIQARKILTGIEGIEIVHLGKADIVRHPVVAEIVGAYSRAEENAREQSQRRLIGRRDDPPELA